MRRCYLVCSDISDARRLRQVHQTVKGYGIAWQYSVFFCILKEIDRARLQTDLSEIIHHTEDQVTILDLGPDEDKARDRVTTLGRSLPTPCRNTIVI